MYNYIFHWVFNYVQFQRITMILHRFSSLWSFLFIVNICLLDVWFRFFVTKQFQCIRSVSHHNFILYSISNIQINLLLYSNCLRSMQYFFNFSEERKIEREKKKQFTFFRSNKTESNENHKWKTSEIFK